VSVDDVIGFGEDLSPDGVGNTFCDGALGVSWPDLILIKVVKLVLVWCAGVEGFNVYYGN